MEADLKYSFSPHCSADNLRASTGISLPTMITVDFYRYSVVNLAALNSAPMAAYATIAQLVEHLICNQRVAGSIPAGGSRE